jgi:hypothetical protein
MLPVARLRILMLPLALRVSLVTPATNGAATRWQQLDLRPPALPRVLAHSVLLTEIGANPAEEAQSVKIVAEPALVPMRSNAHAPMGLIGSLQWSVDHPTHAWHILLPSTLIP